MAPRIVQILETYSRLYKQTGKEQPLIVMARYFRPLISYLSRVYHANTLQSNASISEIIANAEIGCQHITILAHHLQELANTPLDASAFENYPFLKNPPPKLKAPYYENDCIPARLRGHMNIDPLAGPDWDGTLASTEVDWLANDGKVLTDVMDADPAVVRKMKDVLGAFGGADVQAKEAIEKAIGELNL